MRPGFLGAYGALGKAEVGCYCGAGSFYATGDADRRGPDERMEMKKISMQKMRICLRCSRRFLSLSSANRICPRCKAVRFGAYADAVSLEREELRELRRIAAWPPALR